MSLRDTIIILGCAAIFGAYVRGCVADKQIDEIKRQHAAEYAAQAAAALDRYQQMEREKDDAIKAHAELVAQNATDAARARAAADSLRHDNATLRADIAAASRASIDQYAATASELLAECGKELADVAAKADGHAADVRLMLAAWPK